YFQTLRIIQSRHNAQTAFNIGKTGSTRAMDLGFLTGREASLRRTERLSAKNPLGTRWDLVTGPCPGFGPPVSPFPRRRRPPRRPGSGKCIALPPLPPVSV